MNEAKFYGYNFQKEGNGGLGGVLYSLMVALHYARSKNLKLVLIEERKFFPRLNGNIDDIPGEVKDWHSYFTSFSFVPERLISGNWSYYPHDYTHDLPKHVNYSKKIEWYSHLIKDEIFLLREDTKVELENGISISGFNPSTDIVLHIRRTDKIFQSKGSWTESGELPLDVYVKETMKVINTLNRQCRVFICTDDKQICPEVAGNFAKYNIQTIWDETEPNIHFHSMYMAGNLKKSDAFKENIIALKNLIIMSRALYLIGGRMSYFFQLAELLRYPLPTKNIKDNDKWGKAHYVESNEPFANPILPHRYVNFVSDKTDDEWHNYAELLNKNFIVTIPNFMDSKTGETVSNDLKSYSNEWWVHCIKSRDEVINKELNDPDIQKYISKADKAADDGLPAYHFKRTLNDHYSTCVCFSCKLHHTINSYEVINALSKITGRTITKINDTFASKYVRNDFLTLNDDKGDYLFILSLTRDWNPVHGGLAHFCNKGNIYHTESPHFGSLTVFKLDPEKHMDHFVSRMCGSNPRYTYTGWFSVEK